MHRLQNRLLLIKQRESHALGQSRSHQIAGRQRPALHLLGQADRRSALLCAVGKRAHALECEAARKRHQLLMLCLALPCMVEQWLA